MWNNSGYGTGAKVVENWGPSGDAWSLFATKLNAIGGKDKVKAIMVQICVLSTHSEANVKAMIKAARDHVNPGTHIYLVGQPQIRGWTHAARWRALVAPSGRIRRRRRWPRIRRSIRT